MIIGIGFLLMVSLVASAALAAFWATGGAPLFGAWALSGAGAELRLLSFAIVTVIFAMIYKIMPRVRCSGATSGPAPSVTALLFTIGKHLIGLYIGKSGVTSGYGAAGSLVVVLVWVYYSAQIFLLGAEFTWVYARTYGSMKDKAGLPDANPSPTRDVPLAHNDA
jgi:membrane protein